VKLKPNGLWFRWSAPRRGRAPDEVIENFVVIEKVTSFAYGQYGQFVGRIGHRHLLAVIPGAPLVEVANGDGRATPLQVPESESQSSSALDKV
jgi:hypothetical protein